MASALLLAFALASAPAKPALDCGAFSCRLFDSPKQAFAEVLARKPRVLGIGEYHELDDGTKVKSAIKRFSEALLPMLKGKASHLIAETWVKTGNCGKAEKVATQQIEKETERPAATEDEVVTMLKTAAANAIQPHILNVECEDWEDLLDKEGEIDNVKLLQLVTRLLREKAEKLAGEAKDGKAVVIYGGALHNDLTPAEELSDFSFGPALKKATDGRYVQLGLYVPEFLERDDEAKKAGWYPYYEKHVSTSKTLLIGLSPEAFLVVYPRSAKPAAKPAKR
jgi:hypothetical protein